MKIERRPAVDRWVYNGIFVNQSLRLRLELVYRKIIAVSSDSDYSKVDYEVVYSFVSWFLYTNHFDARDIDLFSSLLVDDLLSGKEQLEFTDQSEIKKFEYRFDIGGWQETPEYAVAVWLECKSRYDGVDFGDCLNQIKLALEEFYSED
jgi:hypothetical protein